MESNLLDQRLETKGSPRYYIELLGKALDVIDVLGRHSGELRLTEIANASQIDKATVFRILYTLEGRGFVYRDPGTKKFRLIMGYRRYRVGYAQLSAQEPFSRAVTQGLIDQAEKYHVELLVADNRDNADQAIKNAEWMIRQKVDFAIEFQVHYRVAPLIAEMFARARIPTMAIDIPQPGAVYFGADNYAAGLLGGEALGKFAQEEWRGGVERLLLLEIARAGRIPHSRMIGTLRGIRKVLPHLNARIVVRRDGKGSEEGGYQATMRVLRSLSPRKRILIAAANDSTALGALRAVQECGHERFAAIVGQGFNPDPFLEDTIRRPGSPLIGTVGYFPERYGSKIMPAVLRWLNNEQVPPAIHTDHVLVTRANIDDLCTQRAHCALRAD